MWTSRVAAWTLIVAAILTIAPAARAEAPASTYNWYGQLVAFDASTRTLTVSLLTQDHVPAVASRRFKPGDRVIVTWSTARGEGDYVIYVPSPDEMKNIDRGFMLPAEFVSADAAAKTITVRRDVPADLVPAFQALKPGAWIKVATPFRQPNQTVALAAVAAAEKPAVRPKTTQVDPAVALKNAAAAPLASIAGTWAIRTTFFGQTSNSECTFAQDGGKLSGTCTAGPTTGPVTGEVTGRVAKFQFKATLANTEVSLDYTGIVDAGGAKMTGATSIFDNDIPFEASKR